MNTDRIHLRFKTTAEVLVGEEPEIQLRSCHTDTALDMVIFARRFEEDDGGAIIEAVIQHCKDVHLRSLNPVTYPVTAHALDELLDSITPRGESSDRIEIVDAERPD